MQTKFDNEIGHMIADQCDDGSIVGLSVAERHLPVAVGFNPRFAIARQ